MELVTDNPKQNKLIKQEHIFDSFFFFFCKPKSKTWSNRRSDHWKRYPAISKESVCLSLKWNKKIKK